VSWIGMNRGVVCMWGWSGEPMLSRTVGQVSVGWNRGPLLLLVCPCKLLIPTVGDRGCICKLRARL